MSEANEKKNNLPWYVIPGVFVLPLLILIVQFLVCALSVLLFSFFMGLIVLAMFGIVLLIGGITMFGVGIGKFFTMPMGALAIAGYGLTNVGLAILIESVIIWFFSVLLPAGLRRLCRDKEGKHEEVA